jgi:hypothetical protein
VHTEFPNIPFRSHQLCFFHEYVSDILQLTISMQQLAVLFQMHLSTVRRNLRQGTPQQSSPLGRHMTLKENSEADLVAHILEAVRVGRWMTRKELLKIVRECYDIGLTPG